MRDDLPPFARFVFRVGSFTMAVTGTIMWLGGGLLVFAAGLYLATCGNYSKTDYLSELGIYLFAGLTVQALGSAMCFFSHVLTVYRPKSGQTDRLPLWWLSRFMCTLCFQLAAFSLAGVCWWAFQLKLVGLLWALASMAGVLGFRHFWRKAIELSPS